MGTVYVRVFVGRGALLLCDLSPDFERKPANALELGRGNMATYEAAFGAFCICNHRHGTIFIMVRSGAFPARAARNAANFAVSSGGVSGAFSIAAGIYFL